MRKIGYFTIASLVVILGVIFFVGKDTRPMAGMRFRETEVAVESSAKMSAMQAESIRLMLRRNFVEDILSYGGIIDNSVTSRGSAEVLSFYYEGEDIRSAAIDVLLEDEGGVINGRCEVMWTDMPVHLRRDHAAYASRLSRCVVSNLNGHLAAKKS